MILHFKIFVFIASLAIGVSNIIYLIQIFKKYAESYIQDLIIFNILVNISCFWFLFQHYSSANIWNPTYSKHEILKIVFLMELLIIFLLLIKILLIHSTIKKIKNDKFHKHIILFFIFFVFLMIPFFIIGIKKMGMNRSSSFLLDFLGIIYLIIAIIIIIMLLTLKTKNSKEKILFVIKYTYLILLFLFAILRATSFLTDLQIYHILPFYYFIINIFTFLFLNKFLEPFLKTSLKQKTNNTDLEQIFQNFNLTKREKEIAVMVCNGKSNKEIETDLFISIQTVKFHIYNIYQKTKVKSRIQFVNLINISNIDK